jgi:hypothetical protein
MIRVAPGKMKNVNVSLLEGVKVTKDKVRSFSDKM